MHGAIPLAAFAQLTVIAAVAGGVHGRADPARPSPPPAVPAGHRGAYRTVVRPLAAFADTTASTIALVALHLLAGAIIVPLLARRVG